MLNLKDSEIEYKFPPFVMELGIDGDIKEAMVLFDSWRNEKLLRPIDDVNKI